LFAFPSIGATRLQKETHKLLMTVNKNWPNLSDEIEYTFSPNSEQELIQLHLLNVVSYLENQSLTHLNKNQQKNRRENIAILNSYL
jgi:hypothetical protein